MKTREDNASLTAPILELPALDRFIPLDLAVRIENRYLGIESFKKLTEVLSEGDRRHQIK